MSDLSCPGIDFEEVGVPIFCFQHEIKSANARKNHPADNLIDGGGHFGILDQTHSRGVAGGMALAQYLKVETRQDHTFPANDGAGGFMTHDESLNADGWPAPQERWPN